MTSTRAARSGTLSGPIDLKFSPVITINLRYWHTEWADLIPKSAFLKSGLNWPLIALGSESRPFVALGSVSRPFLALGSESWPFLALGSDGWPFLDAEDSRPVLAAEVIVAMTELAGR